MELRRSREFISMLPRRYRRLIRRVEHVCFKSVSIRDWMEAYYHNLFGWTLFMKILSQECTALQSLRLWVYSDQQETEWLANAKESDPWVQATLQLTYLQNLQHFDMPVITTDTRSHATEPQPSCTANILPWLQARLVKNNRLNSSIDS